MKFFGIHLIQLYSGVLMIFTAPLASAMIGSYYGPGYYLPRSQFGYVYPSQAYEPRPWRSPHTLKWRAPNMSNGQVGLSHWSISHDPKYRFRPMRPSYDQVPRYTAYRSPTPMQGYRWRPLENNEASQWAGRFPVTPTGWQRSMAYGAGSAFSTRPWGYPYFASRLPKPADNRYRFRPLPGYENRTFVAQAYVPQHVAPINGYSFRPLAPQTHSAVVLREESGANPRWHQASSRSASFKPQHWPEVAGITPWARPWDYQRPVPPRWVNNPSPLPQWLASYPVVSPSRYYSGYVFRPVVGNQAPSHQPDFYASAHRAGRPSPSFAGMAFQSGPPPNLEVAGFRENDTRTFADGQIVEKSYPSGSGFDGEGDEHIFIPRHSRPLVSQYAPDERMISDYENNNF